MLTDGQTSSIHKPELLCNPAKNGHAREELAEKAWEYITWPMKETYEPNSLQGLLSSVYRNIQT